MSAENDIPTPSWEEIDYEELDSSTPSGGLDLLPQDEADIPVIYDNEGNPVDLSQPELNEDEARELTEQIRTTADMLYVLISRAHQGKAWQALGYNSFKDYVKEEFNISRSRAYQLLDQAKVVSEIETVIPEGTRVNITEAEARDLKHTLDTLVPELQERMDGLQEGEDPHDVLNELVDEYRTQDDTPEEFDESFVGGEGESYPEELAGDYAQREGFADYSGGGNSNPSGYDGEHAGPVDMSNIEDDIDIDELMSIDEDPADERRKFESVYALYTALSSFKSMPSVEEVASWIPRDREAQIDSSLPRALRWLQDFSEIWMSERAEIEIVEDAHEDNDGEAINISSEDENSEIDDIFSEYM